ncbi:head to tail joining protein [Caudoviricetes sp.]|nr:head to tail joining protein [Caudoviricetes sp.]
MPPEGANGTAELPQPWQSVGSKGLNNLASKLLIILFPPESPFFRFAVSDFTLSKLTAKAEGAGEGAHDVRAEFEEALGKVERAVTQRLEERGSRMQLFETCKHLILGGNGLLQVLPDEKLKLHKLDRFVVKRDQQGNVTELVVRETVSKTTLPDEIRTIVETSPSSEKTGDKAEDSVDIYTWVQRVGKKWTVMQEANGVTLPGAGTYPIDKSPWIPVRLISVDGEDYGRGFVEEVEGDLSSYDSLRQSLVEGAAISARMIPLVDEAGVTDIKQVNGARNGQAIPGKKKDIEFLQVEKAADLRVAHEVATDIKRDLQQAFLLLAGSTRDAERVTAEEIRMIAQELETSSLSGAYSVLSQEFQYPLVSRVLAQMTRRNELPSLPEKSVSLQIVTGNAGLGRSSDFQKIRLLVADIGAVFGPPAVAEYVSVGSYLKRAATALAIDVDGMVRSEEEVQRERQRVSQMEIAKASIGPAAKLAGQQMEQPAAPTQ